MYALKLTPGIGDIQFSWEYFPGSEEAIHEANDIFYGLIGCTVFDIVPTFDDRLVLIVDDEALLKVNRPEINTLASVLYAGFPVNMIFGNALLVQRYDDMIGTPQPEVLDEVVGQIDDNLKNKMLFKMLLLPQDKLFS